MSGFTTRPEIRGSFGMVTSTHWIASAVGFGILEQGGNAFDAALAEMNRRLEELGGVFGPVQGFQNGVKGFEIKGGDT